MRNLKTLLCAGLVAGIAVSGLAQAPQIPVTGTLGSGGAFPLIVSPAVVFTADADKTMAYPEMSGSSGVLIVTSTATLTATRNLTVPGSGKYTWPIKNSTTGGQSFCIGYSAGSCVTVAAGATMTVVGDGTNFTAPASGSGGGVSSVNTRTGAVTIGAADVNAVGAITNSTSGNAGTASALAAAPTPCSGSELAGGVDVNGNSIHCASAGGGIGALIGDVNASGSGSVAASVVRVNGAAVPINTSVLGSNGAGQLVSGTGGISQALSTGSGGFVIGDSICAGTGASNQPTNAWAYTLRPVIGGSWSLNCRPGDQLINGTSVYLNASATPTGDGHSPVTIIEEGTNDVTGYNTSTNLQNSWQGMYTAAVYDAGIAQTIKSFPVVSLAGWTPTGAWSSYYSGSIFNDYVSTTNGNTLAYSATCTAACVGVLDYPVWNGNGGTFTISVNGTPITNPFGGGTTFYNSGFAGATITSTIAIAASSSSKSAVRFPMSTGSNTVTVTVTSATGGGNTVGVNWFALVPVASTNNPPVEALSLQYQNNSNDSLSGTYSGFISSIITQAATDGLNAYFANIRAAILNTNVPINLYVNGAGTSYTPTGWVANTGVSYAVTQTPLTLVGSSPAQGQYAESAGTYTFNIADAATPLSVDYTINCGATESVMFTNCYADALHPNDFGHAVYESVAASSLPSRYVTGNNVPQSTQPYRNYLTNGVFPNQMITPSLLGPNTPISNGGFNPGYSYGCFVGQCYWTGVSNNGLTTFLPYTGGSVVWDLRVLNCGNVQPTANCPYTDFDTLTANGVRTFNSVTNTFNGGVSVNQGGNTAPSFRGPLVAINDSGYFYPTIPTFQLANATNQGETGLRIVGGLTFETGVTGSAQVAGSGQCTPANIWYLADFTGGTCVLREWVGASGVHNFASGITTPTITATTLTDGTCSISGGVLSGCSGGGGSYPLYNASGTLQTSAHTVIGTATVSSNVTVTLSGSAVFTSASSYACTYSPESESSTNGFVPITYTSGSAFVINGDTLSGFNGTVRYICTGN